MYFKLSNRNPYRDLLKHLLRIHSSELSAIERASEYKLLHKVISSRLKENKQFLHSSPAFSERCEHWNQRDVNDISPMVNIKNPWLSLKREFDKAVTGDINLVGTSVSKELAWFARCSDVEDWIVKL